MSYCVNSSCPAQLVRLIEHFVSKGAMDIEGLGIKQGQALIDAGILKDVADIYTLSDHRKELLAMERMAEKSVSNLLDAVEKSKSQPLTRVLVALGISLVGSEVAAAIARHFGSMEKIRTAEIDDLVALDSIGPKIAQSVFDYFRNPSNRQVVDKLAADRREHGGGVCFDFRRRNSAGRTQVCRNRKAVELQPLGDPGPDKRAGRRRIRVRERAY